MFNTLASYILGSTTISDTGNNRTDDNKNLTDSEEQLNIIATACADEEVDDWLLVDKEELESVHQTDSEEELSFVEIKNTPHVRGRHSRNNSGAGSRDGLLSLSPSSILPNSLEDSWFVTPPPCFTATGPINMDPSPFEDLLLEYPSRVQYFEQLELQSYLHIANRFDATWMIRNRARVEDHDNDLLDLELETDHPAAERSPAHTVPTRDRVERSERLGNQQVKKEHLLIQNSQKNHDRKSRQNICRNAIDRGNKVREVNSKRGSQKRKDMNHSKVLNRASNNRKY